jgi:hypothetical protein
MVLRNESTNQKKNERKSQIRKYRKIFFEKKQRLRNYSYMDLKESS